MVSRRAVLGGFSGLGSGWMLSVASPARADGALRFFDKDAAAHATLGPLRILRIGLPPQADDTERSVAYPGTDFATRPFAFLASRSRETRYPVYELIWQDRATTGFARKPNDSNIPLRNARGEACRPEFSDVRHAIGSTLVKAMYSAGFASRDDADGRALAQLLKEHGLLSAVPSGGFGFLDAADATGFDTARWSGLADADLTGDTDVETIDPSGRTPGIVHFHYARTHVDTLFTNDGVGGRFKTSTDIAILQPARLCDLPSAVRRGFSIDCEADDDRAPADFILTIKGISLISTAKGLSRPMVSMDPLTGAGRHEGASPAALRELLPFVQWFNVHATARPPGNDETAYIATQFEFFKGPNRDQEVPGEKMCMQINIGRPGVNAMSAVYVRDAARFAKAHGFGTVLFVNAFGTPGTSEFNAVIAAYLDIAMP